MMTRKGPLRIVVECYPFMYKSAGTGNVGSYNMELLECGHRQRPVSDIYGDTNAHRRRCQKCLDGLPPDKAPCPDCEGVGEVKIWHDTEGYGRYRWHLCAGCWGWGEVAP